jgi:hypothetical protein
VATPASRERGLIEGYRSGLEETNCDRLKQLGVAYEYESLVIPYVQPVKPRRYTIDILLPNGIIIETKGRFVTADRQKHLLVQEQYPDIDLRFVFSNPNTRISKQSQTTYARWCEAKGFRYAKLHIPMEWIKEPLNVRSMRAVEALRKDKR